MSSCELGVRGMGARGSVRAIFVETGEGEAPAEPGSAKTGGRGSVRAVFIEAGIPPVFSNHSFRATGITEFLANGGSLEIAQQLANYADSRTTKLYDRRATRLELEEIVRIRY